MSSPLGPPDLIPPASMPINLWSMLALNANWIGLSFMWNALHPIVLPALLVDLVPGSAKNTYLGLLTFIGLAIAMVVQPLSGAVSDGWSSRYGRRRPLIALGTAFDCVFLLVLTFVGGLAGLVIGYVGLQISSNSAQGPLQALLRDRVPVEHLGVASSIKVFLDLASLVAASLVAGQLLGEGRAGATVVIMVVLMVLLASAAITIGLTREVTGSELAQRLADAVGVRPPHPRERGYWWLIGERAIFLLGIYGLQAFGQYYLQDALRVPDPARQTGNLMAVIGSATIILVVAGGWMADRFGAKRLLYGASVLAASGMLLMVLVTDLRGLYLNGLLIGAGMGLFLTSNWAMAARMAPVDQAGKYLGLTNLATAGAAAASRLEGPMVDFLNSARPDAWLGYKGIFLLGGVSIILSMWFLSKVK